MKNTKTVSFDPNPDFWSTEKNRVQKAKPLNPLKTEKSCHLTQTPEFDERTKIVSKKLNHNFLFDENLIKIDKFFMKLDQSYSFFDDFPTFWQPLK